MGKNPEAVTFILIGDSFSHSTLIYPSRDVSRAGIRAGAKAQLLGASQQTSRRTKS
jgi:hypothetical protein